MFHWGKHTMKILLILISLFKSYRIVCFILFTMASNFTPQTASNEPWWKSAELYPILWGLKKWMQRKNGMEGYAKRFFTFNFSLLIYCSSNCEPISTIILLDNHIGEIMKPARRYNDLFTRLRIRNSWNWPFHSESCWRCDLCDPSRFTIWHNC